LRLRQGRIDQARHGANHAEKERLTATHDKHDTLNYNTKTRRNQRGRIP
jgi:hypothetical protein